MERLTSNNTWEMNMHQLALNQVYIKDGWAWYRNGPEDELSVCDLIRCAAETLGVELPVLGDDGLSDLLVDWLQYGAEEPEGVLAILYRALCAMATVRAGLAAYEDTGLEPEDVTDLMAAHGTAIGELAGYRTLGTAAELQALAAPPPNTPLTLEDLREMDGEPVWLHFGGGAGEWTLVRISRESDDIILLVHKNTVYSPAEFVFECGGKIYRREPDNVPESDTGGEV